MHKPWEHMSRDEKLDYIREQVEHIRASVDVLMKQQHDAAVTIQTLVGQQLKPDRQ